MKVLFLTTYTVYAIHEHYFTKNVWKFLLRHHELYRHNDMLELATITDDAEGEAEVVESEFNGSPYKILKLPKHLTDAEKISHIRDFFSSIAPDIIHSNMIEGYDVEAAKELGIPICLTIHIGGFVCPRGGGNGFLRYDDTICQQPVSEECGRCSCRDLPFPGFAETLYKVTPAPLTDWLYHRLKRPVLYLTPLLLAKEKISQRRHCMGVFQYATLIAANHKLAGLLELNGLKDNVRIIPHGVAPRPKLPFPEIKEKVKLFYLARIQYSKGLHVLLKALDGINPKTYELHIIGDAESPRSEQAYQKRMFEMAKDKNVIFHGRLDNSAIDDVIRDMHMMVFPTICMEVYGISVAESLSIGRPVLGTRCGGAEMQIKDGVNGWLVNPNDVNDLHAKLGYLLDNPELIKTAATRCKLPHPIEEYVCKLWNLYDEKTK